MKKEQSIKKRLIGTSIIVIGVIAIMGIFGTRTFATIIKINNVKCIFFGWSGMNQKIFILTC